MKGKSFIWLIILLGGLILGVLVFFKKPAVVKNQIATLVPQKTADFIKDGNLHLSGEGSEMTAWKILYGEPGNPAVIATLNFNNRSQCDYGSGEQTCNEKHFENGMQVHVEGIKNGDEVTVIKLKVVAE